MRKVYSLGEKIIKHIGWTDRSMSTKPGNHICKRQPAKISLEIPHIGDDHSRVYYDAENPSKIFKGIEQFYKIACSGFWLGTIPELAKKLKDPVTLSR